MKKISFMLILLLIVNSCTNSTKKMSTTKITAESGAMTTERDSLLHSQEHINQWPRFGKGFGNASTAAILMGGDDLTTHKASNKADFREFDQSFLQIQTSGSAFVWNGAYKAIQGANNIIANYEKATGNQTNINQIAGEAFFIRGI